MARVCMSLRGAGFGSGMNGCSGVSVFRKASGLRGAARGDESHDALALLGRVAHPVGDFLEGAEAAGAEARHLVHPALPDARRFDDLFLFHQEAALAAAFARSAFAAREWVGRPSWPQMYSPAAMSFAMSIPVSMPRP